MWDLIENVLGLNASPGALSVYQMSARAVVVFISAIFIVRIGDERFMGRHTTFDVMLGIVFGSVASRAINGSAPFFPTLAACLVLVGLHWAVAALASRSPRFSQLITGRSKRLIVDGVLDKKVMAATHITEDDLREAVRLHGHPDDLVKVLSASLERSGGISIILHPDPAHAQTKSNRPPQE